MEKVYVLIQWEDMVISIIDAENIVQPRKALGDYQPGDYIKARFKGVMYEAVISEISGDKVELERKKKQPLQHQFKNKQASNVQTAPANRQSDKTNKTRKVKKRSAEVPTEKVPVAKKAKKDIPVQVKAARAQAVKRALMELTSDSSDSEENSFPLFQDSSSSPEKDKVQERNAKGFQSTATKEPRKGPLFTSTPITPEARVRPTTAGKVPRRIHFEIPSSEAEPATPLTEPATPLAIPYSHPEPATAAVVHHETMTCLNCNVLEARVKFLETRVKELEAEKNKGQGQLLALARPGVYAPEEAAKHKMVKLVDNWNVYVYSHQRQQALSKGTDPKLPHKDGRKMARFLMNVLFTKEERLAGVLNTNDKFIRLSPAVEGAIIDFCVSNSCHSRGQVRDAMSSQLTAGRAHARKKKTVVV